MTPDYRLEELFTRYWDGTLTPEELAELEELLRTDPEARDRFQTCLLVAMTAGEAIDATPLPGTLVPVRPAAKVSRRGLLKFAGGGVAAGVGGLVAGWLLRRPDPQGGLRLVAVTGTVTLSDNHKATVGAVVPPGVTISTAGTDSSVTLALADRSTITLPGNSAVSLGIDGQHLTLTRGHVAADVRAVPLTIATDDAAFRVAHPDGTAVVVGRQGQHTDLAVEQGRVLVNHPVSGEQLAEATLGDYVTVQSNGGKVTKESRRVIPDRFSLDLSGPLPKRWEVGHRDDDGLLRPEWWHDPYHGREMWEIRSHNEWTRGFARLLPDSVVRVKYRVARPGKSQVCLVVRTLHANTKHKTGVLDSGTAFEDAVPDRWQWFECRADRMLDHKETPGFPAPWVAFILLINTYDQDLGLEVAAVEITRPVPGGRL